MGVTRSDQQGSRAPARGVAQQTAQRSRGDGGEGGLHASGALEPAVARIAAEQLVGPLAAKRDGHQRRANSARACSGTSA